MALQAAAEWEYQLQCHDELVSFENRLFVALVYRLSLSIFTPSQVDHLEESSFEPFHDFPVEMLPLYDLHNRLEEELERLENVIEVTAWYLRNDIDGRFVTESIDAVVKRLDTVEISLVATDNVPWRSRGLQMVHLRYLTKDIQEELSTIRNCLDKLSSSEDSNPLRSRRAEDDSDAALLAKMSQSRHELILKATAFRIPLGQLHPSRAPPPRIIEGLKRWGEYVAWGQYD